MTYEPEGRLLKANLPSGPVTTERPCAIPTLVSVTSAPETAAPLGSSKVPDTLADSPAEADGAPGKDAFSERPALVFCARSGTAATNNPRNRLQRASCFKWPPRVVHSSAHF